MCLGIEVAYQKNDFDAFLGNDNRAKIQVAFY